MDLPGDRDARKRVDEVATEAQVFSAAHLDGQYYRHLEAIWMSKETYYRGKRDLLSADFAESEYRF